MDDATTQGIKTTYPYETDPTVARHQCEECGGWQRADKADKGKLVGEITHTRRCDSKPQIQSVAAVLTTRNAEAEDYRLRRFAERVRRDGLTNDRDADVRECVRRGYLTESNAMNTDD